LGIIKYQEIWEYIHWKNKIDLAWKVDYKIDASMDKTYFKDMT